MRLAHRDRLLAQVDHEHRTANDRKRQEVHGLEGGERPERVVHGGAERRMLDPLKDGWHVETPMRAVGTSCTRRSGQ